MHGAYGSKDGNWFPWLKEQLTERGDTVILEQFPVDNWETVEGIGREMIGEYKPIQTLNSWEQFFSANILPKIEGVETSFVGHSLAPIFMLHMLEKYEVKFERAVFVAPFFDIPDRPEIWQFYPVNKTFYNYEFDFDKIKSKIDKSYVVYGDDDPYVPATEPPLFAEKLEAEVVVVPGGKHCGSNFKEFPQVLELIDKT